MAAELPPDWTKMKPEFAAEAVDSAIEKSRANIAAIKALPTGGLDYENCVLAFDSATEPLDTVYSRLGHLVSVADSDALRAAYGALVGKIADFYSSVRLDDGLYAKLAEYAASPEGKSLEGARARMLSETLLDFELGGAKLPAEGKRRIREIDGLPAQKAQKFSENVLDDTKRFTLHIGDPSRLEGLPPAAVAVAAQKAAARGESGWDFTLEQPSYVPFMSYAADDSLREKLWRASARLASDGEYSNWGLMEEILRLRAEKARILGRADFADLVLERRMARSGAKALAFVEDLRGKFSAAFESEWRELLDFSRSGGLLDGGKMPPWRAAYASEKLRAKKYGFDPESLRPYFPMEAVMRGMFEICRRLYGIEVSRAEMPAPAWDSAVELFEARAPSGGVMGLFYADFRPRKNKRAGAWMNLLEPAKRGRPALGVIAGNLSEPAGGKPALLSHSDVETLFHEFGHLIHFFMMDSPELSLRNVAWDFVELPSQIMENWCRSREGLDVFARHYETGEKIPEELFEKFEKSRKFMGANAAMRQLSFAQIDLLLHVRPEEFIAAGIENAARRELAGFVHEYSEAVPTILPRFTHLFGDAVGYAAGYYSYKWAEVLEADAFSRFEREGIFNPEVGAEFAEKVLRVGNSVDPAAAFRNFMGRDPDASALVARSIDSAARGAAEG